MKLILDAHLPASLAQYFSGHDVLHTSFLPQGNFTSDSTINEISILEDRALITKDSDFYYSFVASRKPKKVELLKLFSGEIPEGRPFKLKKVIAKFLLDKAKDKADAIWDVKGYSDEKLQQTLHKR